MEFEQKTRNRVKLWHFILLEWACGLRNGDRDRVLEIERRHKQTRAFCESGQMRLYIVNNKIRKRRH